MHVNHTGVILIVYLSSYVDQIVYFESTVTIYFKNIFLLFIYFILNEFLNSLGGCEEYSMNIDLIRIEKRINRDKRIK